MGSSHICKDCIADPPKTVRKIASEVGPPLCATHLRMRKVTRRKRARARHVERTYKISADDNAALYVYQGGKCWICQKATGAVKQLAVDHDHADDWPRGRLCGECNQFIGQRLGDDPKAARRLLEYLSGDTPYRRMLAQRLLDVFVPGAAILGVGWSGLKDHVLLVWKMPDGSQHDKHIPLVDLEAMKQ